MQGVLSRIAGVSADVGTAFPAGAEKCDSGGERDGAAATAETSAATPSGWDVFVYGLFPGKPLVAATADSLIAKIAASPLDTLVNPYLPHGSRREIVRGEHGYYCCILVPRPHSLPDVIPLVPDGSRATAGRPHFGRALSG